MSDKNNQNGDFGAFLAGFVIGGLVGAAVALILAPRSGSEIRSQLMERGEEFRSRARNAGGDYFTSTRSRLQEVGGDVKERVRIVLDEGRTQTSEREGNAGRLASQEADETEDASTPDMNE